VSKCPGALKWNNTKHLSGRGTGRLAALCLSNTSVKPGRYQGKGQRYWELILARASDLKASVLRQGGTSDVILRGKGVKHRRKKSLGLGQELKTLKESHPFLKRRIGRVGGDRGRGREETN